MPTGRCTARRNTRPTSCRSSIRRRTRSRPSRCRCAMRTRRRRSGPDMRRRQNPWRRRHTGATRRSGTPKPTTTTPCSTRRAACGWRRRLRGMDNPAFCKKGSDHPSAKVFPLERSARQVTDPRSQDDEVHLRRHLLRHASSAVRLRCQRHAVAERHRPVAGWINTRMFDETGDAAKAQGWSPFVLDTNGNGKRDEFVEPNQPRDPAKDTRFAAGVGPLCSDAEPCGWLDLVHGRRVRRHAGVLALRSRNGAVGSLQCAAAGLRHPRRRHRQERRRLGVACKRPSRQLRSAQVQGSAQRTERHRRALSRGLVVLPVSRPGLRRASARTAPSRAITPGSTSTTRSALARTFRCRPPISMTAWSRSRTAR